MKEIDGWVKIKKYTDDKGKPVCGECFIPYPCGFYKDVPITKDTVPNEPGPLCPVWHGGSKGEKENHAVNMGHTTRYSDSSYYDEVCCNCGATDAQGDDRLLKQCPVATGEQP